MAGGKTVATVLILDHNGKPAPLTLVSFSVNSKKVSWPDCKTDAFGKVVLTWPTDWWPYLCEYSVGQPPHTGDIRLDKGELFNLRIKLVPKTKTPVVAERKFRLVEKKTTNVHIPRTAELPPIHASVDSYTAQGVHVPQSRVLQALMLDERTGVTKPAFMEDDGQPFGIAATKWEKANCLPLGKARFVPVVNTTGHLVAWYNPTVSPDHLFLIVPPLFLRLFPDLFPSHEGTQLGSLTVYDPKGVVKDAFFSFSKSAGRLEGLGFPGGSGGIIFGLLFDINGKVLSARVSSTGKGGRGDPLFDQLELALTLAGLVKGLVVGITKYGYKILRRKKGVVDDAIDDVIDDTIFMGSASGGKESLDRMSEAYGKKVAEEIYRQLPHLKELQRIKRIKNLDEQYKAISKFIDDYKAATGIKIEVVPRHSTIAKRDLTQGNWGTYAEREGTIYMHEDVWTKSYIDTVREIGHEVGAAEIVRILKISKDQIPRVEFMRQVEYLTQMLDKVW